MQQSPPRRARAIAIAAGRSEAKLRTALSLIAATGIAALLIAGLPILP